jgi:fumarate hydratase class II
MHVVKIGRTHLMDATPLTLGQVGVCQCDPDRWCL